MTLPSNISDVGRMFDESVVIEPISDAPIAAAVLNGRKDEQACLVTINGCSCDLIRGGHRMAASPHLLLDGITKLLLDCAEVSLLMHWFTQLVKNVPVAVKRDESVSLKKLKRLLPRIEEDVRYVVTVG